MTTVREKLLSDAAESVCLAEPRFTEEDCPLCLDASVIILDKVLEALRSPEVRQQITLEIDPLENKMTIKMVETATEAIIAVLGQGE